MNPSCPLVDDRSRFTVSYALPRLVDRKFIEARTREHSQATLSCASKSCSTVDGRYTAFFSVIYIHNYLLRYSRYIDTHANHMPLNGYLVYTNSICGNCFDRVVGAIFRKVDTSA